MVRGPVHSHSLPHPHRPASGGAPPAGRIHFQPHSYSHPQPQPHTPSSPPHAAVPPSSSASSSSSSSASISTSYTSAARAFKHRAVTKLSSLVVPLLRDPSNQSPLHISSDNLSVGACIVTGLLHKLRSAPTQERNAVICTRDQGTAMLAAFSGHGKHGVRLAELSASLVFRHVRRRLISSSSSSSSSLQNGNVHNFTPERVVDDALVAVYRNVAHTRWARNSNVSSTVCIITKGRLVVGACGLPTVLLVSRTGRGGAVVELVSGRHMMSSSEVKSMQEQQQQQQQQNSHMRDRGRSNIERDRHREREKRIIQAQSRKRRLSSKLRDDDDHSTSGAFDIDVDIDIDIDIDDDDDEIDEDDIDSHPSSSSSGSSSISRQSYPTSTSASASTSTAKTPITRTTKSNDDPTNLSLHSISLHTDPTSDSPSHASLSHISNGTRKDSSNSQLSSPSPSPRKNSSIPPHLHGRFSLPCAPARDDDNAAEDSATLGVCPVPSIRSFALTPRHTHVVVSTTRLWPGDAEIAPQRIADVFAKGNGNASVIDLAEMITKQAFGASPPTHDTTVLCARLR